MTLVIDYSSGIFEAAPSGETVGTVTGNATLDLTSGNLFNHTPTANTTFVFSNPPTTGSAYDMTLKVVGANVTAGYGLANASYDSVSFSVSGQESIPIGLFFKPDGTKMYVSGPNSDAVFQYSLSTAWDLSTASYDSVSFSVSSQDLSAASIYFKSDGTKMYLAGYTGDSVYQYTLSTAWDLSTASYDSVSFSVASQATTPFSLIFKPDGTKMFLTDGTSDAVKEYSLSTAWDISTASYQASFGVASQETNPYGLEFNPDGTKMYIVGITTDTVYEYALSTAWDITTASYSSVSFSVASQSSQPAPVSMRFGNDGQKLYVSDAGSDTIYQYSTSTTALATLTYPSSVKWAGGTAPSAPANGNKDVYNFFTIDGGTTYYGFQAGDAMA